MKIVSDAHELLYSGSFITFNRSPIQFTFEGDGAPLLFRLVFKDDVNDKRKNITIPNFIGEREMEIHFINFQKGSPIQNTEAAHVGSYRGKALFFRYAIQMPAVETANGINITYTFYLGGEVANG